MAAIQLDDNSLIMISPVTVDEGGEIVTMGLPTQVSLADFMEYVNANITPVDPG